VAEMTFTIANKIKFCMDIILKEAKLEDRLVKEIFYIMLSAYTNNPINLAINSPSGEGKNYVLRKVASLFPQEDVMFVAGMSAKALFHRNGILVIKNEIGGYDPIDKLIEVIDTRIEDLQDQHASSNDNNLKQGLKAQIKSLEDEKKDLHKDAKKLIDLSNKIIVFLDTPNMELFNAIMPLLSHDNFEVEYEYADSGQNGIKTKGNILRGWPAVIFAQALDYSHYKRYPEIQRRFIITNPKMTVDKYKQAVGLIGKKYGLPDFMYQAKVVSTEQKEQVKEIIKGLRDNIINICSVIEPGASNVIVPFEEVITESLPTNKALDMTTAYRLFSYLSLLPMVNIDDRPKFVIRKEGEIRSHIIPFATFEDLREAMSLIQFANGVRPYILEWYNEVFVPTYNTKYEPDSKTRVRGEDTIIIEEDRKAVTTGQLVDATETKLKKRFTTQKILEQYVIPLMNEGYIDKQQSNLHGRDNIYYPVVDVETLIVEDKTNNDQGITRIKVNKAVLNPTPEYINTTIQEVVNSNSCSFEKIKIKEIQDCDKKPISVDELIEKYYSNSVSYFQYKVDTTNLHFPSNTDQDINTNEIVQNEQAFDQNHEGNQSKSLIDEGETINDQGSNKLDDITSDTHIQEQLKDIPKESWTATTITPSESTCIYCDQSVTYTELVAHMDKCAADAVADYEHKRSLD
jgi:hypothetical protein